MKTKLKQIYNEMRQQPVIARVTFLATALSVFLVMIVMITQRVRTVPFAPESCRDHLLLGIYLHSKSTNNDANNSSGSMSYHSAKTLYSDLDGVERMSYFSYWKDQVEVSAPNSGATSRSMRMTDAQFFDIFDHKLVEGRFYTPEEAEAMMPVVVITESVAKKALGEKPWVGQDIVVNHKIYSVIGVVRDHSALATTASSDVFLPLSSTLHAHEWNMTYMGSLATALLVKDGVDFDYVRSQVRGRYAMLDAEMAADSICTIYHDAPFDQQTIANATLSSNNSPDTTSGNYMRWTIYAILLIVPAINLSSMLHSRLRRRINEIGIRRAFGCTRRRIIADIITENLVVTLAGGIAGTILGIIVAYSYTGLYQDMSNYGDNLTPNISALLNWGTVLIALGICFILNLLSAAIPAWQTSRLNLVHAINSK